MTQAIAAKFAVGDRVKFHTVEKMGLPVGVTGEGIIEEFDCVTPCEPNYMTYLVKVTSCDNKTMMSYSYWFSEETLSLDETETNPVPYFQVGDIVEMTDAAREELFADSETGVYDAARYIEQVVEVLPPMAQGCDPYIVTRVVALFPRRESILIGSLGGGSQSAFRLVVSAS